MSGTMDFDNDEAAKRLAVPMRELMEKFAFAPNSAETQAAAQLIEKVTNCIEQSRPILLRLFIDDKKVDKIVAIALQLNALAAMELCK